MLSSSLLRLCNGLVKSVFFHGQNNEVKYSRSKIKSAEKENHDDDDETNNQEMMRYPPPALLTSNLGSTPRWGRW